MMDVGQLEKAAADKKSVAAAKRQPRVEDNKWVGFVDVELTPADKALCAQLSSDWDAVWADIEGLVEEGYKLSLSYDDAHTTWNASVTCRQVGSANKGYTLSGRGGTLARAVSAVWFKHFHVLEGDWSNRSVSGSGQMALDGFG